MSTFLASLSLSTLICKVGLITAATVVHAKHSEAAGLNKCSILLLSLHHIPGPLQGLFQILSHFFPRREGAPLTFQKKTLRFREAESLAWVATWVCQSLQPVLNPLLLLAVQGIGREPPSAPPLLGRLRGSWGRGISSYILEHLLSATVCRQCGYSSESTAPRTFAVCVVGGSLRI